MDAGGLEKRVIRASAVAGVIVAGWPSVNSEREAEVSIVRTVTHETRDILDQLTDVRPWSATTAAEAQNLRRSVTTGFGRPAQFAGSLTMNSRTRTAAPVSGAASSSMVPGSDPTGLLTDTHTHSP